MADHFFLSAVFEMLRAAGGPLYARLFCGRAKKQLRKQGSAHFRRLSAGSSASVIGLTQVPLSTVHVRESFTFDADDALQYQCIRVLQHASGAYYYYRFQSNGAASFKPISEGTAKVLLKNTRQRRSGQFVVPRHTSV